MALWYNMNMITAASDEGVAVVVCASFKSRWRWLQKKIDMIYSNFTISAIHILAPCSPKLRKCLKEDWYFFNHRLRFESGLKNIEVVQENPSLANFYGRNIHIGALVGVNGSGKSSLLELEYRIINNLSCILNRGKRRQASETLYYVDGLHAELFYVVENKWGCISCQGNTIKLKLPERDDYIQLEAFPTHKHPKGTEVLMKDFIEWAKSGLFYTIVTNYSLQAFLANDFLREPVYLLDRKAGPQHKEDASWINGLFHKNDGYTTPLVLNPYRDNGIINMVTEHRLTLYRLSSCFIHARNNGRQFIRNYNLNRLYYEYNPSFVQEKLKKNWDASETAIWNYRPNKDIPTYADVILNSFGFDPWNLEWDDDMVRNAALYLADKTLVVALHYPGYEEFKSLYGAIDIFQQTTSESEAYLKMLVGLVNAQKSHETIKIHQVRNFLLACRDKSLTKSDKIDLREEFDYDNYVLQIGGNPKSKKMGEILDYLPPSFFSIHIELDHIGENGKRDNKESIPVERLSSGERQYLYTFSTYIYHILNILSIQHSNRVRYRCLNIVLDEVEICFHPEYQRCFVYELINYLERLQLNQNASFNIQIATHSPFILSDVMEDNVLYLKDGKNAVKGEDFKNPFCANICDLLYQSFFLEKGFYGEYSRTKVNGILHSLRGNKRLSKLNVQYIKTVVELIGDDFLKMHLHQLMDKHDIEYEEAVD